MLAKNRIIEKGRSGKRMTPVQLSGPASTALVIFFAVASFTLVGLLAAVAYLIWKLNLTIEGYRSQLDPLLSKVEATLALTTEKVNSIGDKTERILVQGEATATVVQQRVDTTTAVLQKTVNAPVIGLNSLLSGVTQGWQTFRQLQTRPAPFTANSLDGAASTEGPAVAPDQGVA